jgi:D-glycero-D-manno-heptose 1,7-bisphosphate phosphatase
VFLDRDGVLNAAVPDPVSGLPESPLHPEQVRLLPDAALAARALADAGYALVCVTNQPAAAKGKVELDELLAVHERALELLRDEGVLLDATRLCPHHPDGSVRSLAWRCPCRKPGTGMLVDAAAQLALDVERSWMIGDTDADIRAGRSAGCRTLLVEYPPSAHKRSDGCAGDARATDLGDAVARVRDGAVR